MSVRHGRGMVVDGVAWLVGASDHASSMDRRCVDAALTSQCLDRPGQQRHRVSR